ncbi:MAG: hypothetical protein ABIG31_01820 [Candidatus Omnitrophota bacterium]
MTDKPMQKKGVLLLIVITTIVIAVILSNVILNIMLSQGRLTTYELNRIQAKYACMAGINWGYENLRSGNWAKPAAGACDRRPLTDAAFPSSIRSIDVYVASPGAVCQDAGGTQVTQPCSPPAGAEVCISVISDYLYTP